MRLRRGSLPGVSRWYHAGRLGSTQDQGRRLAEAGAPSGTLVTAATQTRGRGRMDRRWASGRGGLYLTLLLRPEVRPDRLADLSLAAARAVARTLSRRGVGTRVAPPNDVEASTDGRPFRKVAGILAEAASLGDRTEWVLIGVGVNVNNRLPPGLPGAASLRGLLGRRTDTDGLLRDLMGELESELEPWRKACRMT